MITERLTFQAKYGRGDELVALFRDWFKTMSEGSGIVGARLYTDATGPMFTIVLESDFPDMAAAARFMSDTATYQTPEFQRWFEKMTDLTERGERQLLNSERLL